MANSVEGNGSEGFTGELALVLLTNRCIGPSLTKWTRTFEEEKQHESICKGMK